MNLAIQIIEQQATATLDNFSNTLESLLKWHRETGDPAALESYDRLVELYRKQAFSGPPASENNAQGAAVLLGSPASENNQPPAPEPNYFAPKKIISMFLCGDWFDAVSANARKYTKEWRTTMMEALLDSEYKDGIAETWADPGKRTQMKCAIVGILIDAKVIKGSYRSVAAEMNLDQVKPESLARYMSNARKQPYYDWLLAFANR